MVQDGNYVYYAQIQIFWIVRFFSAKRKRFSIYFSNEVGGTPIQIEQGLGGCPRPACVGSII